MAGVVGETQAFASCTQPGRCWCRLRCCGARWSCRGRSGGSYGCLCRRSVASALAMAWIVLHLPARAGTTLHILIHAAGHQRKLVLPTERQRQTGGLVQAVLETDTFLACSTHPVAFWRRRGGFVVTFPALLYACAFPVRCCRWRGYFELSWCARRHCEAGPIGDTCRTPSLVLNRGCN